MDQIKTGSELSLMMSSLPRNLRISVLVNELQCVSNSWQAVAERLAESIRCLHSCDRCGVVVEESLKLFERESARLANNSPTEIYESRNRRGLRKRGSRKVV